MLLRLQTARLHQCNNLLEGGREYYVLNAAEGFSSNIGPCDDDDDDGELKSCLHNGLSVFFGRPKG